MSEDLYLPTALAVLVLVLAALLFVTVRALHRARAQVEETVAASRAESAELRERVDSLARHLESGPAHPGPSDEFVITDIGRDPTGAGEPEAGQPATRIEGRLFADIVLRESALKAASFGAGLRRALSPESRNRIRFEMKRELKRSRKQRRNDLKDLRRDHAARERAQQQARGDVA